MKTYFQLALGMAAFGSATPVSKIVTAALPVFVASGIRVLLGAVLLAPFALRHRQQLRNACRRDWYALAAIALFGMFGFSVLMLYGMRSVSGVAGAIVMSTAPAVTAAGSMLFMRDRPTWRKLAAIALAVGGVLVLQLTGGEQSGSAGDGQGLGIALVFGAVCCEAAYTLLGKSVLSRMEPLLVAGFSAMLAIPLFLPFALWQWHQVDWAGITVRDWSALGWYGAGTLALGSWLWYSGVARVAGSVAATFMGIMPASALVLSYVLLDEPFSWMHLAGFGIVFAGVLLISWEHARMRG